MLRQFRYKAGTFKVIIIFAVVYIVSQVIIVTILHPLDSFVFLKAQTTFSKEQFLKLLYDWDKAGLMERYLYHFYFDFVHSIWYSVLLGALIAKAMNLNRFSDRGNILLPIPFIAGIMDLTENIFHITFITDYSSITDKKLVISALASNTKWLLVALSLLLAFSLYLRYLVKKGAEEK